MAGDKLKVEGGDPILLAIADAVTQVVGLLAVVRGETCLSKIRVLDGNADTGHGEVWVEFDGTLRKRNGFGVALSAASRNSHAVGLQRFEGGCSGLYRHIELLYRGE